MADNVLGLLFEISADPTKAITALSHFRGASDREFKAVTSHISALQSGAEKARASVETSFGHMARSVQGFGDVTLRVFAMVAEGILRNMELERLEVIHKSKSEASKLFISKQAIKELAVVRAVEAFAKGLEALGDLNFFSAAKYFASAALYGSIAATQVTALLGAGGGGRVRGSGRDTFGEGGGLEGVGSSVALAAGAASALNPPSGNVTVLVMGEPQAASWLTKVINTGVLQQDLMLVASHTKRSPPAGR